MSRAFHEEQRFTKWWLWVILLGVGLIPAFGIYKQVIVGEPFGDRPLPDVGLYLFLILTTALLIFFWKLTLRTAIDSEAIRISFFPFAKKNIPWDDVATATLVDYGIAGGWGVRSSTKYGTVYNVRGSRGLAVELKSGKKYYIGTQREEELRRILQEIGQVDLES